MRRTYLALCALAVIITVWSIRIQAQDAKAVVATVSKTMGADNLKTLQFSGMGSNAGIGQNVNPNAAWPLVRVKSYKRLLDLNTGGSYVQMTRVQNNAEQMQTQVVTATSPWAQQFDYWVTPYAFLKGAQTNQVTARSETLNGTKYNVLSFTLQNKYKVEGYINDKNLVERVRTWIDNDVLGDMLVEGYYGYYKDFGGLQVPTFIAVKQAGFPTLILDVSDAKANAEVTIPAPTPAPPPPPVTVQTEKITDGVYYLKGGTHHSVLVEFADHVVLIEAPQNEQRSIALLSEVQKLYPSKPLRYVVNTHHHFDHSGGLRTIVDAGVTIVTQDVNKPFYEKSFANARTLNPDRLERSKKKPVIEIVGDKKVMSDATRTLELDLIKNNTHNDGILMAFLPKEKILVEVDMYTPPAANAPAPAANAPVNPNALALLDNLEKLRLDFDTILPLHGPGKATRADLYAFVKKPLVPVSSLPDPNAPAGERGGRGGGGRGARGAGRGAGAGSGSGSGATPPPPQNR